jgi:hypothetical protein
VPATNPNLLELVPGDRVDVAGKSFVVTRAANPWGRVQVIEERVPGVSMLYFDDRGRLCRDGRVLDVEG